MSNSLYDFVEAVKTLTDYNSLVQTMPIFVNEKSKAHYISEVLRTRQIYIQDCKKVSSTYSFPLGDLEATSSQSFFYTTHNKTIIK